MTVITQKTWIAIIAISVVVIVLAVASATSFSASPSGATTQGISLTSSGVQLTSEISIATSNFANETGTKANITSLQIFRTGKTANFLLVTSPDGNGRVLGAAIMLNLSLVYENLGDEAMLVYNSTATSANITLLSAGFHIVNLTANGIVSGNPVFLPQQTIIRVTLLIAAPAINYSGPLKLQIDAEPAGGPVYR